MVESTLPTANAALAELIPEEHLQKTEQTHNRIEEWLEKPHWGAHESEASKAVSTMTVHDVVTPENLEKYVEAMELPTQHEETRRMLVTQVKKILLTSETSANYHKIDLNDGRGGSRIMEKFLMKHRKRPNGDVEIMIAYFGEQRKLASSWKWLVANHKAEDLLQWLDYKLYRQIKKKVAAVFAQIYGGSQEQKLLALGDKEKSQSIINLFKAGNDIEMLEQGMAEARGHGATEAELVHFQRKLDILRDAEEKKARKRQDSELLQDEKERVEEAMKKLRAAAKNEDIDTLAEVLEDAVMEGTRQALLEPYANKLKRLEEKRRKADIATELETADNAADLKRLIDEARSLGVRANKLAPHEKRMKEFVKPKEGPRLSIFSFAEGSEIPAKISPPQPSMSGKLVGLQPEPMIMAALLLLILMCLLWLIRRPAEKKPTAACGRADLPAQPLTQPVQHESSEEASSGESIDPSQMSDASQWSVMSLARCFMPETCLALWDAPEVMLQTRRLRKGSIVRGWTGAKLEVTSIHQHYSNEFIVLHAEGVPPLRVTPTHRMMLPAATAEGTSEDVSAGDLREGDTIQCNDGPRRLSAVRRETTTHPEPVFQITFEPDEPVEAFCPGASMLSKGHRLKKCRRGGKSYQQRKGNRNGIVDDTASIPDTWTSFN